MCLDELQHADEYRPPSEWRTSRDSPGAVVEIPVAKRARVSSVTALSDGSKLSTRKVGEKLFVTVPGELPADSDYVIKVTLK